MTSRQGDTYKTNYITHKNTIKYSLHNKKSKTAAGRFDDKRCHRVIHSTIVQQHIEKVFDRHNTGGTNCDEHLIMVFFQMKLKDLAIYFVQLRFGSWHTMSDI